ncbi:Bug family tripartite tricarboxylate transporter substrate binding protein [Ottowia thiooxydans]|uniref:Bug family tripartite tricarboxylate transporter substrate binding protein n=1 Tax=Ottowia thiooxydans TaxID=219182 RepID=UPI0003FEE73B|nr:tripartite tricarboxylate transporter substrate binding protein [Ottowia thiooxydans]
MTPNKNVLHHAAEGTSRRRFVASAVACALPTLAFPARAQAWPKGPIRVVVPHPAGGPADQIARIAANGIAQSLGATLVVDNRPGGGGMLGAQAVAQAKPDGETLLVNASVHVTYPALFKQVAFDVIKDFTPITQLTRVPMLLVINPQLPVNDVKGLIAYAKANPGKLSFGSSGNAGAAHLAGELFKQLTGADMVHVPYRGAAPALTDLIGGQIQVMFDPASSSMQHIRSGKLRALAVTSPARMALVPDLPTMIEAGLPGYVLTNWYGLWAPKDTPAATVQRIYAAAAQSLKTSEIQAQIRPTGAEVVASTPEEFARFVVAEKDMWAQIVVKSGAKLD